MAERELVVLAFDNEEDALNLRAKIGRWQQQGRITIEDAAIVIHPKHGKPQVTQSKNLVQGRGALGGVFWGLFIGVLFMAPWLGMAVGAAVGSLAGKLGDIGLDSKFIKEVGELIEPGHSALFLLISKVDLSLEQETIDMKAHILKTSLPPEAEAKLRAAFEIDDVHESE